MTPEDGTDRLPETSVRNYHYSLPNNPERGSSQHYLWPQMPLFKDPLSLHNHSVRTIQGVFTNLYTKISLIKTRQPITTGGCWQRYSEAFSCRPETLQTLHAVSTTLQCCHIFSVNQEKFTVQKTRNIWQRL